MSASVDGACPAIRLRLYQADCNCWLTHWIYWVRGMALDYARRTGLPFAAYWVLDVEQTPGHSDAAYSYAWLYACTSVMGVVDEFVYFFSRTPPCSMCFVSFG